MGSFSRRGKRKQKTGPESRVMSSRVMPSQLVDAIAELKRLSVEAKALSDVQDYFDALCGRFPEFLRLGRKEQHHGLESVLLATLKITTGLPEVVEKLSIHIPEHDLWHGFYLFEGALMNRFIYFADRNCAVCAAAQGLRGPTRYFRFAVPESVTEPLNPQKAQLIKMSRRSGDPLGRSN